VFVAVLDVNRTVAAQRVSRGDVLVEFGQHRIDRRNLC